MDPNTGAQLLPGRDKAVRPLLGTLTSSCSQATRRWTGRPGVLQSMGLQRARQD